MAKRGERLIRMARKHFKYWQILTEIGNNGQNFGKEEFTMTRKPNRSNAGREVVTLGCINAMKLMSYPLSMFCNCDACTIEYASTAAPSWKNPSFIIVIAY